jgi:hypothetical protein
MEVLRQEYWATPEWQEDFESVDDFINSALPFEMETAEKEKTSKSIMHVVLSSLGCHVKYYDASDDQLAMPYSEVIQYTEAPHVWHTLQINHKKRTRKSTMERNCLYKKYLNMHHAELLVGIAWKVASKKYQHEHGGDTLINALYDSPNQLTTAGSFQWRLVSDPQQPIVRLWIGVNGNSAVTREYDFDVGRSPVRIIKKHSTTSEEIETLRFEYPILSEGIGSTPSHISWVISKREHPNNSLTRNITVNSVKSESEWDAKANYHQTENTYSHYSPVE